MYGAMFVTNWGSTSGAPNVSLLIIGYVIIGPRFQMVLFNPIVSSHALYTALSRGGPEKNFRVAAQ